LILEKAKTYSMKELTRRKMAEEYAPRRASVKPAAKGASRRRPPMEGTSAQVIRSTIHPITRSTDHPMIMRQWS
jgi:hypothetical protein